MQVLEKLRVSPPNAGHSGSRLCSFCDQTCSLALSAWSVCSLCWLQGLLILTVGCAEQGIVKALCCVLEMVQSEPSSTKNTGCILLLQKRDESKAVSNDPAV